MKQKQPNVFLNNNWINRAIRESGKPNGLYLLPLEGTKFVYGFSERRDPGEAMAELESKGYYGGVVGYETNYLLSRLYKSQLNRKRRESRRLKINFPRI